MPKYSLTFWWEAFHTATYLINRLPTPILNHKSPFETLFHKLPYYNFLQPFGYAAYPYITSYNTNKLQFHSIKCVFIGYSDHHKGYICISPQGRVYTSRHVIFYHTDFPYPSFVQTNQTQLNASLSHPSILIQASQNRPFTSFTTAEQSLANDRFDSHLNASPIHPSHDSFSLESSSSTSIRYALPSTVASQFPSPISASSTSTKALPTNNKNQLPTLQNTTNLHPMVIRSKFGITKSNPPFIGNLSTTTLPDTVSSAIQNLVWFQAMETVFCLTKK